MSHTCHAHGCKKEVPPKMMCCFGHWTALRPAVRNAVWREYRIGQEDDKRPSLRYLAVQQLAVAELCFRPNSEEAARTALPYLEASEKFRALAIINGHGDPLKYLTPRAPLSVSPTK